MITVPILLMLITSSTPLSSPRAAPAPVTRAGDEIPQLLVGDRKVKGKQLKAYESHWTASGLPEGEFVREVGTLERIDGRKCYKRRQVWPMGNGLELHAEIIMDASTLETIRFQREVKGLPEGASLGQAPVLARWDFEGAKFTCTQSSGEGEPIVEEGELETPMFDGNALGLVLAALPLKDGYEARIPVAMTTSLAPELTLYTVHLRVVGQEAFGRKKGKDVDAWVVEVDWIDHGTETVSSKGGAEEAGGAYYVVPRPPKGFPHVPRYANESTVIQLSLD